MICNQKSATDRFHVCLKINQKRTFKLFDENQNVVHCYYISLNETFLPLFSTSQVAAPVRLECSVWKFIYQRHIAKTKSEWRSDDFNIGLNQPLAPTEVERQTLSQLNTWKHIAILFHNGFVIYYTLSFCSWEKEGFSSHWL